LGKTKKTKNLAHKISPCHPFFAQGFLSFFAVGIKKIPSLATAKKPFPLSSSNLLINIESYNLRGVPQLTRNSRLKEKGDWCCGCLNRQGDG
jgi:hypothetical protein